MSVHIHAAGDKSLNIALIDIVHGLAPDGNLSFKPAEQFKATRDVRGNVCRSRMNDPLMPVDLKLWNWSKHNAQLSEIHAADTLSNKGVGLGTFSYIDNGGSTKILSEACWVMGAPDDWTEQEDSFIVTWKFMIVAPPEQRIFGGSA